MSRRETIDRTAWRVQVIDLTGSEKRVVFEVLCSHEPTAEATARDSLARQIPTLKVGQRAELQERPTGKHRFLTREVHYRTTDAVINRIWHQ